MLIGYVRVSTLKQNEEMQVKALTGYGVKKGSIYYDKSTGANAKRKGFISCMKALREGDTLVVWSLDRIGRSVLDLLKIVGELQDRGVNLVSLYGSYKIDTSTPMGKMLFTIHSAFAEYQLALIQENTAEGLANARAKGRVGGRKRAFTANKILLAQQAMKKRTMTVDSLCEQLGVSRSTLYRHVTPNGDLTVLGQKVIDESKRIKKR